MRRDELRQNRGGTYIETINPLGYDILINGSNRYLNFNAISGSSGYGIRDNSGSMEFKDSGGAWASFTSLWTSVSIGGTVTGGTVGSVLFVGTGPTLGQDNANLFWDDTNNRLGIGTNAPTYSLVLSDTTTGFALFSTPVDPTNYSRLLIEYTGSLYQIGSSKGGTGTARAIRIGGPAGQTFDSGTSPSYHAFNLSSSSTSTTAFFRTIFTSTASSNVITINSFEPTINQSGTAGYTGVRINVTESSTGSGTKLLQDWQVGSSSKAVVDNGGKFGFLTTAPTHTLTLASTSTGIALYNTSDQTTNYERALISWATNTFTIAVAKGGTGTARRLALTATAGTFRITETSITATTGGVYVFAPVNIGAGASTGIGYAQTASNSSGNVDILSLTPTWSQTGTASYTVLFINSTETTTGSGVKNLILAQVGGVTRFGVSSIGDVTTTGIVSATGSITSTITGASSTVPVTITVDSSVATQTALLVQNATNYAHTGNLITGKLLNATDSGAVLKLENAGSGNYITADSVFSIEKSGLINSSIGLRYISSPSTDDTYNGISVSLTAAAITAQWEIGYMNSSGKVALADASAISTSSALFIATAAISADAAGIYLLHGIIRNDAWNWTVGGLLYLSETAGAITQTAPSTTDSVTQIVGIALSADTIYWKPEILGQVEHT